MTRIEIPDGYFCDALPGGYWVSTRRTPGAPMASHLGDIPLDRGLKPGYVRASKTGAFLYFAGQSDNSPETLVWDEWHKWQPRAVVAAGVNPVIFDNAGELHIQAGGPGLPTQGYRYVDYVTGQIVSGEDTITSRQATPPFDGLSEWTSIGDGLYIGQCGVVPGCALWDGTNLRMIEAGDCFFIRATRVPWMPNDVAIALVKHVGQPSVCLWLTLDELRAMPIIEAPPIEVPTLPAFAHPVLVAPFFPRKDSMGECFIVGNAKDYRAVAPDRAAIIATIDALDVATPIPSRLLAVYGPTATNPIQDAIARADTLKVRVVAVYDAAGAFPGEWLARLRPVDLPSLELYQRLDETLSQSVTRWTANVLDLLARWPYDIGVSAQTYLGAVTLDRVLAAQVPTVQLVNSQPRIKLVAPFADDRGNGGTGVPELRQCIARLVLASPGVPVLVPIGGPPAPTPPVPTPTPVPAPSPAPTPQPIPSPEVPVKVQADIRQSSVVKHFLDGYSPFEETPHPDGQGLVALKTDAGRFKSMTPAGDWQDDADNAGSWERFMPAGGAYIHQQSGAAIPRGVLVPSLP